MSDNSIKRMMTTMLFVVVGSLSLPLSAQSLLQRVDSMLTRKYRKGDIISGLDDIQDSLIFHAGTKTTAAGKIVTNGGRVLCVTSLDSTLPTALLTSLQNAEKIKWKGCYFRHDIGQDLLKYQLGIK
jgi:phosphoribosylamine--glycine ligase